ncbi:DNA topoisomerase 2-associated protein Pat1p [[Candida] anglica]|uniref:DNA topoisomerase 2-associated protein Pat1p n=1 Tax=[Candida] anglica TaxID=148631 RepID=A0ABP0ENW1_9ASCO
MSFFGFDPSLPPQQRPEVAESYDFQDTYDGLDEADAFNDQTFGNEQQQQSWNEPVAHAPSAAVKPAVSYAQAANTGTNDDEFMHELWGTEKPQVQQQAQQHAQQQQQAQPEKKVLSLEEIEAQLTAIDHQAQQQHHQLQPPPFGYPGMMPHPQFGGYMMPPGGYLPPPGQYGQFMGAPMPMHQQVPVQQLGQQPIQQMQGQQQHAGMGQLPPQAAAQIPGGQLPPQAPAAPIAPVQQQVAPSTSSPQQAVPQQGSVRRASKVDMAQFPVLGAKGDLSHVNAHAEAPQSPQRQQQSDREHVQQGQGYQQNHFNHHQQQHQHQHQHHRSHSHHQNYQDLTPEQQAKLAKRQEKVARIMKYSGIMNPRDKDYVTRFQLSQIVTEDPYNEDFYAQVFKVIHPKANSTHLQEHAQQHNSIAQAYLEQSGHRLGGRYNKADLALQRMQQQVQKAVTVAKERPKLTQYAREGSLGKISFGNGKKPRQQLEIFSQAAQREIEKQEQLEKSKKEDSAVADDDEDDEEVVPPVPVPAKKRAMSISAVSTGPKKSYTKKDVMNILETIITKVMNLESASRVSTDIETAELWESLHILDQPSTSGVPQEQVNPFIQCLNHNKALKILPRLFKFLSREQILTIVTLVMSNLENLSVISKGSYTTYPDKVVSPTILKLVETYSLTFSKVLMNAVQDFKFNEIIGLLVILIEHNNVSLVSTTKIGLSILTTLLSRAELIKGEGVISATDLSEWSSCYDELFTSLESRIASIFPPHPQDIDDGSSRENYVWQFLATLSLGGKLSHQRIIVDEVRDEIFGVMNRAKAIENSDLANLYKKQNLLNNLNMYLVVMGLVADENEIRELQG